MTDTTADPKRPDVPLSEKQVEEALEYSWTAEDGYDPVATTRKLNEILAAHDAQVEARARLEEQQKLRDLAKDWRQATVGIGNYATMRPLTEVEKQIARACADQLEAVLRGQQ